MNKKDDEVINIKNKYYELIVSLKIDWEKRKVEIVSHKDYKVV